MRITEVETIVFPNPGRAFVWVLIKTDEGITGLGESTLMGRERAVAATIEHMSEMLVGEDPFRREFLWNRLFLADRRRGGAVVGSSMGGIDVALWDIQGQALGLPIHALLGGRVRDRVRCYNHTDPKSPDDVDAKFSELLDGGWTAAKFMATPSWPGDDGREVIDPGKSIRLGAEIVEAARSRVGDDFDLLLETHGRLRPVHLIEFADRIAPFHPMLVEEPTRPEAIESFRLIREKTRVPLATGERLYHRWAFQPIIENDLVDIIQPDIVHSHGLSEVKRIADYADTHLILVAPHNPQSPVNTMASLHLDFVIPNFLIQEVIWPFPAQLMELFDGGPTIEAGYADLPEEPGLGIRLNEKKAKTIGYESSPVQELRMEDGSVAEW